MGKEVFDRLQGYQVVARFENESRRDLVKLTGKHRGQRSVFEGNVECILEFQIKTKEHKLTD